MYRLSSDSDANRLKRPLLQNLHRIMRLTIAGAPGADTNEMVEEVEEILHLKDEEQMALIRQTARWRTSKHNFCSMLHPIC